MNPSHSFESLAGVFPGVTTVAEVTLRFGPPAVSDSSDGGLYLSFEKRGIHVIVAAAHRDAADPLVDEVRFNQPSKDELPCGVRIGQSQDKAIKAVRRSYRITDEYDDAVYFRPSARDDLLASVEFRDAGVVVGVELMYQSADSVHTLDRAM